MNKLTVLAIALCILVPTSPKAHLQAQPTANDPASAVSQSGSAKRREGSIIGRLVNESGQPIPHAAVNVRRVGASAAVNRSIGTDQDGRFQADDLPAGAYSVSAYVPGYVSATETPERQIYRVGETVILRMIKGATISGTVTNSFGEPIVAARVNVIRVRDGEGRATRGGPSGNSRQTDDRGVYRIYGLQSGSYLIVVSGGGQTYYPSSGYDGDAPTYYPSTTRDAATEVTVRAGDEIGGIDIRYRGERGHIVSGTLAGALGKDSRRASFISLTRAASGALESNTFVPLSGAERGFAIYGVPDGEYDLVAHIDMATEGSAASAPRRVKVKGTDVTGIDLVLAPLGSIAGRIVLEALPESERKGACKDKPSQSLDEMVIVARRDEKAGSKDQSIVSMAALLEGSPDEKGEFRIHGLFAGRFRIETRLPGEDWFVRSITAPGPGVSKQPSGVSDTGLAISSGQRANDLVVTLAEGAAGMRGKVVPAAEGKALPSRLRVHVVPAEPESLEAVLRYAEAPVESDGAFSISNLAPGRYFLLTRALSDEEFSERTPRPLAWDAASRTKLRGEAEAANSIIELQRCQRVQDYVLKYSSPPGAKKRAPRTRS